MSISGSKDRSRRRPCPGCQAACGGCWSGLLGAEQRSNHATSELKAPAPEVGVVKLSEVTIGHLSLRFETWPNYRIGGSAWPSGFLLARALAEGLEGLPAVQGLQIAELGAGPGLPGLVCGKLGASKVCLTDYEELVPLIRKNIELNDLTGVCYADTLDWQMAEASPLAIGNRGSDGVVNIVLAADVVYFEEQDPLVDALKALMVPGQTQLVLAYRERTPADRAYLEDIILPRLQAKRIDYESSDHGSCEIYVGCLRQ